MSDSSSEEQESSSDCLPWERRRKWGSSQSDYIDEDNSSSENAEVFRWAIHEEESRFLENMDAHRLDAVSDGDGDALMEPPSRRRVLKVNTAHHLRSNAPRLDHVVFLDATATDDRRDDIPIGSW